jgi:DNA-binding transcriptional MerR regulator
MKELSARSADRDEGLGSNSARARFLPSVRIPDGLPDGPVAIADMANAFGVTHRTLHFYEEKRLIKAGRMGLMRVYSVQDVHRMAVITLSREVGMPIAVIQELMAELATADSQEEADDIFTDALMIRKRELISSLSTVHRQMQQITHLLDSGEETGDVSNDNAPANSLSDMEIQCLELMAEGLTPARMARGLGMEAEEAQAFEMQIIRKFSANNRFQAVAKAVLLGIVK